jgi:hypothetical protein
VLSAQPPAPVRQDATLGFKCAPVPESLRAHLPEVAALKPGQGLLVESVNTESRAAELGLKPFDIVLAVGTTPVKTADDLRKLGALPPGERELVQIVRGGKPFVLTVASPGVAPSADHAYVPAKSLFKPGGPPAVSVEINPLTAGDVDVNLFFLNPSNKMERHALHGSFEQIELQVTGLAQRGQMSENIHDLIALALKRARDKNDKNDKNRK